MLARLSKSDNKTVTILTGAPGSGKSTATQNRKAEFSKRGIVFDAPYHNIDTLQAAIDDARAAGVKDEDIQVVAVYNDLMTTYSNAIKRGIDSGRWLPLQYFINSFRQCQGKIKALIENNPNINIVTIDNSNNQGRECPKEEAANWDYTINEEQFEQLKQLINENSKITEEKASELLEGVDMGGTSKILGGRQESDRRGNGEEIHGVSSWNVEQGVGLDNSPIPDELYGEFYNDDVYRAEQEKLRKQFDNRESSDPL